PILESRLGLLRNALDAFSFALDDNLRAVLHQLTCDELTPPTPLKNIDELGSSLRECCLLLMAKEHPVAGDLKYAMAALRVGQDYERIQELADALYRRAALLRSSRFKDICKDMTAV